MTVRFVVLGCGRIGSMHAEYLHRRVAGAEVVGVFDVFAEAAESGRCRTRRSRRRQP